MASGTNRNQSGCGLRAKQGKVNRYRIVRGKHASADLVTVGAYFRLLKMGIDRQVIYMAVVNIA